MGKGVPRGRILEQHTDVTVPCRCPQVHHGGGDGDAELLAG